MVKLNDSFSGEGNAVLRVDSELVDSLKERHVISCTVKHSSALLVRKRQESDEQAMDVIFDRHRADCVADATAELS